MDPPATSLRDIQLAADRSKIIYTLTDEAPLLATASFLPIKSDATGTIHGAPVSARTTINPVVVKAALSYRF